MARVRGIVEINLELDQFDRTEDNARNYLEAGVSSLRSNRIDLRFDYNYIRNLDADHWGTDVFHQRNNKIYIPFTLTFDESYLNRRDDVREFVRQVFSQTYHRFMGIHDISIEQESYRYNDPFAEVHNVWQRPNQEWNYGHFNPEIAEQLSKDIKAKQKSCTTPVVQEIIEEPVKEPFQEKTTNTRKVFILEMEE